MAPTHSTPKLPARKRRNEVLFTLPLLLGACTVGPMIFAACRTEPTTTAEAETPAAPTAEATPAVEAKPADSGAGEPGTLAKGIAPTPTPEPGTVEAAPAEPAVAPPTPAAEAPKTPHRVLILGDSLAATGFGALLEKKLDAHADIECFRKGKSASGLARPDFFDWPTEAGKQLEFRKPDLVVVIMGGNDGQDLTRKKGKRVAWSEPEAWKADYRARMDDFLASLVADDRKVLWLGLPTMGMRSLETKLETIRQIQREAVDALGDRAHYVDTAPFVTAEDGSLLAEAKVGGSKKPQAIRAEDRIHFTMSGSEYFADKVLPEVLGVLGVEPTP